MHDSLLDKMKTKPPLNAETVFTYWEGKFTLVNRICTLSIKRVFNERHIHITPETLGDYIDVSKFSDWVFKTNVGHRPDMIRIFLLREYGGWSGRGESISRAYIKYNYKKINRGLQNSIKLAMLYSGRENNLEK